MRRVLGPVVEWTPFGGAEKEEVPAGRIGSQPVARWGKASSFKKAERRVARVLVGAVTL